MDKHQKELKAINALDTLEGHYSSPYSVYLTQEAVEAIKSQDVQKFNEYLDTYFYGAKYQIARLSALAGINENKEEMALLLSKAIVNIFGEKLK
jgi:hypothetical protein